MADFQQIEWDASLVADCQALVRLALAEDLGGQQDWTTAGLVPAKRRGTARVVTRGAGMVAGIHVLGLVVEQMQADITVTERVADRQAVEPGTTLAILTGSVRDLLTAERTCLNLLSRLMGIATLTSHYAAAVAGSSAAVYDTRKTTPGWRRLEKYATRCGGARNHRRGLYDAVLIKDNHLAQRGAEAGDVAGAVREMRQFLAQQQVAGANMLIEVEVDGLQQLQDCLAAAPDIVLLDNMSLEQLREAVRLRDSLAPAVELEASGGVTLATIGDIAATGVERISVGALTHSASALDLGLDWADNGHNFS